MPLDSQTIVDRIRKKLPSDELNKQKIDTEQINQRFKQCIHYAASEAIKRAEQGEKDPAVIAKQLIENDLKQQAFFREYRAGIEQLVARDECQTDELNQLAMVEDAQGARSAKWRLISTLGVGSAILLLYAVAGALGIALPLSGLK